MDSKNEAIKRCPFCGSEGLINHEVERLGSHCKCANNNCSLSKLYIPYEEWQKEIKNR